MRNAEQDGGNELVAGLTPVHCAVKPVPDGSTLCPIMPTDFRGRRAAAIESDSLRVTVLEGGSRRRGVSPKQNGAVRCGYALASIEPSPFDPPNTRPSAAGQMRLLAGIMGHNLCLDIFGGPSDAEAAAGLTVHGEASAATYEIETRGSELVMSAALPMSALHLRRTLELRDDMVLVRESVRNLSACDRPIGWTQHVTIAPPFLEHGQTELRTSATRSKVFESQFGPADYLSAGAEFDWPNAPAADGTSVDLRIRGASSLCGAPGGSPGEGFLWHRRHGSTGVWIPVGEDFPAGTLGKPEPPQSHRTTRRDARLEFGVSPFPKRGGR